MQYRINTRPFVYALATGLLAVGCAQGAPTPTPTATATAVPTPTVARPTPTPMPIPTATPVPPECGPFIGQVPYKVDPATGQMTYQLGVVRRTDGSSEGPTTMSVSRRDPAFLYLNMKSELFQNPSVRKAVDYTVPFNGLQNLEGQCRPSSRYETSLRSAKDILEALGYDGLNLDLIYTSDRAAQAKLIAATAAAAKINLTLYEVTPERMIQHLTDGDYGVALASPAPVQPGVRGPPATATATTAATPVGR